MSRRTIGFAVVSVLAFMTTNSLEGQWVRTSFPGYVNAFAVSGTNLFVGTMDSGVFLSTNNGTSWTPVNTGLPTFVTEFGTNVYPVYSFAPSGTNLFAGIGGGVVLSTNMGTSWTWTGLTHIDVIALAVSGTNLFAGTMKGVYLSTDNGTSWTATGLADGVHDYTTSALVIDGMNLFAATPMGIFLSTNNAASWTQVTSNLPSIMYQYPPTSMSVIGPTLFVASGLGYFVYATTNNGSSWNLVNTGLTDGAVITLTASGTILFGGTLYGHVFVSTNKGSTWTSVSTGLTNSRISALAVNGGLLFAGTYYGIWRRPMSEMVTSVPDPSRGVPTTFGLDQNYPNPFNPSTTIHYQVPKQMNVSLRVFNTLGQTVATLVNEQKETGDYQVQWNANVPSGVYFYRLQAGEFMETKKMILTK